MRMVSIGLTEKQEKFLREFSEKQYCGAKDNVGTVTPIHVVQSKMYNYIPYSDDIVDYYDGENLRYSVDEAYEGWYKSVEDIVQEHCTEWGSEEVPFMSYSDAEGGTFKDVNGEDVFVTSEEEYLEVYGIKLTGMCWKEPYWKDVAVFFIRDEAERYIGYQRHNLNEPRVYTKSLGYSNYGDFPHLRELLMNIGKLLNKEGKNTGGD